MSAWLVLFYLCILAFTAAALVTDLRSWRLPNWLTVSAFVAGVVFHITIGWVGGGMSGVLDHLKIALLGFLVGFGILFVAWLIGSGSAGDAKLMGAIGVWLGPLPTFLVLVLSAMIELGRLLGVFLYRSATHGMGRAMHDMKNADGGPKKKPMKGMKVPYALSAVVATWCVVIACSVMSTRSTEYWQPRPHSSPEVQP